MTPDRAGFGEPAAESQACFRAVLDAMARPGKLQLAGAGLSPPATLHPATAAVLLTLVDGDAPLWLDPALAEAWDWIAFHCGAVAAAPAGAAFACAASYPAGLNAGTDLAPESSATLVLQVPSLGSGALLRLSGPGIETVRTLAVGGLPPDFAAIWSDNASLYPCGIDLVLCAGHQLCALPRTTRVEEH